MSKTTFILIAAFLSIASLKSFGQKLEVNKTDDFTKKSVKETSCETLFTSMTGSAYFRISLTDTIATFDLKYQDGNAVAVVKDEQIMLLLDNGQVITLPCVLDADGCIGCGAKGFIGSGAIGLQTSYSLSKEQISTLKRRKIAEVKIIFATGVIANDVKDKNAEKIQKALNLIM